MGEHTNRPHNHPFAHTPHATDRRPRTTRNKEGIANQPTDRLRTYLAEDAEGVVEGALGLVEEVDRGAAEHDGAGLARLAPGEADELVLADDDLVVVLRRVGRVGGGKGGRGRVSICIHIWMITWYGCVGEGGKGGVTGGQIVWEGRGLCPYVYVHRQQTCGVLMPRVLSQTQTLK